jgi:hypothetical protein
MIKIDEVEQYLTNEVKVPFGLAFGGNKQIIDIVFDNVTEQEAAIIKDNLVKLFPEFVKF